MKGSSMMRLRAVCMTILFTLALFSFAPTGQAAEDAVLADFAGTWVGSGLKEEFIEEGYYEYKQRDLNVTIQPGDKGFTIGWMTGIRKVSGGPVTELKSTDLRFQENAQGYYQVADVAPQDHSHGHTWARLEGQQLIVYLMEIHPEGYYELAMYVRTLNPDGTMLLGFVRNLDGRPVRRVSGLLIRAED
jgi:hypothetical protein